MPALLLGPAGDGGRRHLGGGGRVNHAADFGDLVGRKAAAPRMFADDFLILDEIDAKPGVKRAIAVYGLCLALSLLHARGAHQSRISAAGAKVAQGIFWRICPPSDDWLKTGANRNASDGCGMMDSGRVVNAPQDSFAAERTVRRLPEGDQKTMSRPLKAMQPSEPGGNRDQTSVQAHRQTLHQVATNFDHRDPVTPPLAELEIEMLNNEYDRNIALARDTETHRSTVMTLVVAGVGAVVYSLATLKFDRLYWSVPLVGTLLGAYGAILVNIYHERWMFHMMIARGCRLRIAAALPGARLEELRGAAKAAHREQFKRRKQLYVFWNHLAIGISLAATACAIAMLIAYLASVAPT